MDGKKKKETIISTLDTIAWMCRGVFNLWRITITFGTGGIPGAGGSRLAEISF